MKTDVHEHDDHYEIVIDLPGFKKDQINLELQDGYLTVSAAKGLDKDETTKEGKMIRQERYAGAMQRSFYVGDAVKEADFCRICAYCVDKLCEALARNWIYVIE